MAISNRRAGRTSDRRHEPRGGRRAGDRPGHHPTVLVAESYEHVRRPLVRYLEHFKFDVIEAASGAEVMAAVKRSRPKVILTELTLPNMAAVRLSKWLEESVPTPRIPIIAMADELSPDIDTKLGRPAGLLFKPFPLVKALEEVRRVLRARTNG